VPTFSTVGSTIVETTFLSNTYNGYIMEETKEIIRKAHQQGNSIVLTMPDLEKGKHYKIKEGMWGGEKAWRITEVD